MVEISLDNKTKKAPKFGAFLFTNSLQNYAASSASFLALLSWSNSLTPPKTQ
jgi:hypothetical protein